MTTGVGELVRKLESDYRRGNTKISKHVTFNMLETIEKIEAYVNSKHVSGETDNLGRKKPFFNIVTSAVNIWYRATDIDRKHIRVRAGNSKEWINSFLATVKLHEWMRRSRFGTYLNDWGRTLSKYCSAVTKIVENDSGLHITVIPWNAIICDAVDFENNPKIEPLELTPTQLKKRIKTHGYDATKVKELLEELEERETPGGQRKDNKAGYIKLYELHGELPLSYITFKDEDEETYVNQIHVISYVGVKNGRNTEYKDFTLYSGQEDINKVSYHIAHLIKEDNRTIGIGAVENLFHPQQWTNHSKKAVKDILEITSKLILQTADAQFVGRNILTDVEAGNIFVTEQSKPLTKVETSKPEIVGWDNYAMGWKQLGNEINGISEAMLGAQPKSGTAWRQTEAMLQESYSLFEVMTENKGLAIEDMMRDRIIPYIKTQIDDAKEVSAILEQYDIDRIDGIYIKNEATKRTNKRIVDAAIKGVAITPEQQAQMLTSNEATLRGDLASMGNQRFFSPDEVSWKEQLKDLEWNLEVEVTEETKNVQEALTTLNTALKLVLTPGFEQNKKAQMIVGRVLEMTGAMSPIEYAAIPNDTQQKTPNVDPGAITEALPAEQ